jgi:glutamine amidotransferase
MCRHLGYLGPGASLAELVLDQPHSLARQSWAPADMRAGGTVNADGFGIGWFARQLAEPVVYRRATPMWSDAGLSSLAGSTRATGVLAAVRSATVGMPVIETACAPFVDGRWLFSHNGVVRGWPDSMAVLARRLPVTELLTMDAPTDSALLWALVRRRLRDGASAQEAVERTVLEVAAAAPGSRLNLMLTDGSVLVATAWTHALSTLATPEHVVVASEPWDTDPRWSAVPDKHMVVVVDKDDPSPPKLIIRPLCVAADADETEEQ